MSDLPAPNLIRHYQQVRVPSAEVAAWLNAHREQQLVKIWEANQPGWVHILTVVHWQP